MKRLAAFLVAIPSTVLAHPGHESIGGGAHHFHVEGLIIAALGIAVAVGLGLFLKSRNSNH